MPCWGHLVEGTLHLQWTPGKELQATTLLLKSQSGEQSSLCQREENSNRMDFQAVARLYCVRAPKMQMLAPTTGIQVGSQDDFPAGSKNVPDRPGLTSSLLQRKHDRTAVWRLL